MSRAMIVFFYSLDKVLTPHIILGHWFLMQKEALSYNIIFSPKTLLEENLSFTTIPYDSAITTHDQACLY